MDVGGLRILVLDKTTMNVLTQVSVIIYIVIFLELKTKEWNWVITQVYDF